MTRHQEDLILFETSHIDQSLTKRHDINHTIHQTANVIRIVVDAHQQRPFLGSDRESYPCGQQETNSRFTLNLSPLGSRMKDPLDTVHLLNTHIVDEQFSFIIHLMHGWSLQL